MTTKEAMWVSLMTAQNKHVKIKNREVECTNITDKDYSKDMKFSSENGFENPFKGIRSWHNGDLKVVHSMCIMEANGSKSIRECNLESLELILDEK